MEASIFRPLDFAKEADSYFVSLQEPVSHILKEVRSINNFKKEVKIWENIWYFGK